jgi:hypothetical protein
MSNNIHKNIYEVLKTIKIPKSTSRPNVSGLLHKDKWKRYGNPCESCTFGLVNNLFRGQVTTSSITKKYPEQYDKLVEYGKHICEHEFTSICVNHNVKCQRHKDGKNVGVSTIVSVGDFTDGGLWVEDELIDIFEKPYCFNGAEKEHATQDFDGDRYSIIYFDNTSKRVK